MDILSKTWVEEEQMKAVFELFHQEPVIRMARNVIANTIFSGGIEVNKKGKKANKDFQQLLETHWIPFANNVLDHIMMFGFCPFMKRNVSVETEGEVAHNGSAEVPIVPPFGSYKVEIRLMKDYTETYHFYPISKFPNVNEEADERVQFLVPEQYKPSMDGVLRSQCTTLMHSFHISREFYDLAMHAENLRAHPPLIAQRPPDKNHGADAGAMEMFEFADGDATMARDESSYAKNQQNMNDFYRQQNMCNVLNGKHPRNKNIKIDPLTGRPVYKQRHKQTWEDNVFVLPEGQQLAPHINPQTRADLLEMERSRYDLICGVLGIPSSFVLNDRSSRISGMSDISYKIFMRSMYSIRDQLSILLKTVFEHVYPEDNKCIVSLPFIPATDVEDIIKLSQQGVVSQKTAGLYLLRTMGLPESDLDLQPKEVKKNTEDETNDEPKPKKQKVKDEM